MKRHRRTHVATFTQGHPMAWRVLLGSVAILILALAGFERAKPQEAATLRARMGDGIAPIVSVIQSPVQAVHSVGAWGMSFLTARSENTQLRAELQQMQQWQAKAHLLQQENDTLRNLLHVVPEPQTRFITARFINASEAHFSSNALINAGTQHGVKQRHAVVGTRGLIGVVGEVGHTSARVLLLTDANARVAVVGETSGERAIAAGNGTTLSLLYTRPNHGFTEGERLITSGDGGFFPAGIPVARLESLEELQAAPFADPLKESLVSVVDFTF